MLRRRLPTGRPWAAIIHDRRLQRRVPDDLGKLTLTVGITQFVGLYETQRQYLFVASLIGIVPVVVGRKLA